MFRIVVESGPAKDQVFLSPENLQSGTSFRLGRDEGNDITFPLDFISSSHGEFIVHHGKLFFRDLRSTNGSALSRDDVLRPLDDEHGLSVQLLDQDRLILGETDSQDFVKLRIDLLEASRKIEADFESKDSSDTTQILAVSRFDHISDLQGRLAEDPTRATKIYQSSQLVVASLQLKEVCNSTCAAMFELLPNATHISLLLDQTPPSQHTESSLPWYTSAEDADLVPFLSVDREGNAIKGERPSRHVVSQIIQQKAAILVGESADVHPSQSIIRARIRSIIGVPVVVRNRLVGIIQIDNRSSFGIFSQSDLEASVILIRQMGLAIENARLFQRVKIAEERLSGENQFLKNTDAKRSKNIIGESKAMFSVFELVDRVVDTDATVLITGETGTGKELIARSIHYKSKRKNQLFIAQNCSAIPENLLESELFGHKKGSFTGADSDKKGLFEIAHGGTIFLDEIGETSPALQAKLLRVLQESEIRPLGAMYPKKINARIIAATNRNLEKEVEEGNFRQDLYYRLNVFPIRLPPLKERRHDITLLAEHFLTKFSKEYNRPSAHFSPEANLLLQSYPWPGNIRELENEVQRLVIYGFAGDLILPEHLAERIRHIQNLVHKTTTTKTGLKAMLEEVERWILLDALNASDGNKTRAAKSLKITREGLHKKLSRFGI